MNMSSDWIERNLYSVFFLPNAPCNAGKIKWSDLDKNTQMEVCNYFKEILRCIDFLKKAGMLSQNEYQDLLLDGLIFEREYLEDKDVGFKKNIDKHHLKEIES